MKGSSVSIVVVTYNSSMIIENCLKSIIAHTRDLTLQIIVVDNNSQDQTDTLVQKFPEVILIANKVNCGFAAANNQAFKIASGDFVAIVNPDIKFTDKTNLFEMIGFYNSSPMIGLVAPKLLYEDGSTQESVRSYPALSILVIRGLGIENLFLKSRFYTKYVNHNNSLQPKQVDWVIGAFMLVKKNILNLVGGFDTDYFMYYEDADLCLRLQEKKYEVIYYPYSSAIHLYKRESTSKLISKLKLIHIKSTVRFLLRRRRFLKSLAVSL